MNDNNRCLLIHLTHNAQMGTGTLPKLIERAKSPSLINTMQIQLEEYRRIYARANAMLSARGYETHDISPAIKLSSSAMISCRAMTCSVSKMAEMLIIGSTRGIIGVTKQLHRFRDIDSDVRKLAEVLLETEQNNVDRLRAYL